MNAVGGWLYPKDKVFPLEKHIFEGKEYNVPRDTDYVLRLAYGDWEKLLPIKDRQWHATIVLPTQAPDVSWAMSWDDKPVISCES